MSAQNQEWKFPEQKEEYLRIERLEEFAGKLQQTIADYKNGEIDREDFVEIVPALVEMISEISECFDALNS